VVAPTEAFQDRLADVPSTEHVAVSPVGGRGIGIGVGVGVGVEVGVQVAETTHLNLPQFDFCCIFEPVHEPPPHATGDQLESLHEHSSHPNHPKVACRLIC